MWNAIDDNVKLTSSISVFKKRLKDQYVKRYYGLFAVLLYISQNFIMACFIAFERNQFYQILKIASISPKRWTHTIRSFSLSLCLVFSLILSFADCSDI